MFYLRLFLLVFILLFNVEFCLSVFKAYPVDTDDGLIYITSDKKIYLTDFYSEYEYELIIRSGVEYLDINYSDWMIPTDSSEVVVKDKTFILYFISINSFYKIAEFVKDRLMPDQKRYDYAPQFIKNNTALLYEPVTNSFYGFEKPRYTIKGSSLGYYTSIYYTGTSDNKDFYITKSFFSDNSNRYYDYINSEGEILLSSIINYEKNGDRVSFKESTNDFSILYSLDLTEKYVLPYNSIRGDGPYLVKDEADNYKYIDENDNTIVIAYGEALPFKEGIAAYKNEGLWTVIGTDGDPLTEYKYDNIGNYSHGFMTAERNRNWYLLDSDGNEKIIKDAKMATITENGMVKIWKENIEYEVNEIFIANTELDILHLLIGHYEYRNQLSRLKQRANR